MQHRILSGVAAATFVLAAPSIPAVERPAAESVREIVAALDTEYQAAVERNDWQTMDRILHPDFCLVLGDGRLVSRADLVASARDREIEYDRQVEEAGTQSVRLFGEHTATVTALLRLSGKRAKDGSRFEYRLWFTDTYVLTTHGWKYAFGQASTRLPEPVSQSATR